MDWDEVDWKLPNTVIRDLTGRSLYYVIKERTHRGIEPSPPPTVDWSTVDWTQKDTEIQKLYGFGHRVVTAQRKMHCPRPNPEDRWKDVDWSLSNAEISDLTGATRDTVAKWRAKSGKLGKGERWSTSKDRDRPAPEGLSGMSIEQAKKAYSVSDRVVWAWFAQIGEKPGPGKSNKGFKHSKDARDNMSEAQRLRALRAPHTEESKKKIGKNHRKHNTLITRLRISAALTGHEVTAEARQQNSASHTGVPLSPAHIQALKDVDRPPAPKSLACRIAISIANMGRKPSQKAIDASIATRRRRKTQKQIILFNQLQTKL